MSVSQFIKKLNQNFIFKFISSIRLAVPLMLIVGAIVAYGTVIESNYNAEYAAMAIYKAKWFGLIIIALWINIFAATISRIPFKLHHTGFVITHIGLLTLLIGGYITNSNGIDGQLVIPEKQASSTVVLPHLMVGYQFDGAPAPQILKFNKTISEQDQNDLSSMNDDIKHLFTVKRYIPFAKIEKQFVESTNPQDQSVALSFILKSNFFNVSEWLHSEKNPQMKLGPALLKIVKTDDLSKPFSTGLKPSAEGKRTKRVINSVKQPTATTEKKSKDSMLILTSTKDASDIKKIKVSDLVSKEQTFKGIKIKVTKVYQRAVVSENKVVESEDPNHLNPALELSIEKDGKKLREILYAKFAGFSLNQDGVFGYKLSFVAPDVTATASAPHGGSVASGKASAPTEETSATGVAASVNPDDQTVTAAQAAMSGDNTIVFSVSPNEKGKARVTLLKNNRVVMTEILNEGQSLQTPWMGMKIFLGSVMAKAVERVNAQSINPEKSQQLPPSALLISTAENPQDDFWLAEGEQKSVQLAGKNAVIYFGRQTIDLPFDLMLEKFSKVDYPGTTTPMSFESLVQVARTGIVQKISMNEPLKLEGFTIYQASYSITPEQTLSIFSVNQDPGRFLKYLGSLILGIGIITITLMRSRVWKNYLKRKNQNA